MIGTIGEIMDLGRRVLDGPLDRRSPEQAGREEKAFLLDYILKYGHPFDRLNVLDHRLDLYDAVHADMAQDEVESFHEEYGL